MRFDTRERHGLSRPCGSTYARRCAACSRRRRSPTSWRAPALAERRRAHRPDVDDLTRDELEQLRLVARRLHREALAVAADEIEPDVEPEVDDAVDHHLACRAVRLQRHLE